VAEAEEPRSTELRASVRRPIELKVEYKRLNTFFADYTKNISRGGTFIKTGRPLPIGTEFLFKLFVPSLAEPLTIHGEVQRIVTAADVRPGEDPGMAIRFVYREGDPQAEIARIVEAIMTDSLGQRLYARLMDHANRQRQDPVKP
jgi:type IV pilus assembly protein PilZ